MLKYDEAIKVWGAKKLSETYKEYTVKDLEEIQVMFEFDKGYACCGGRDEDCYCSLAASPKAEVYIAGEMINSSGKEKYKSFTIDIEDFSFENILKELFEIGSNA